MKEFRIIRMIFVAAALVLLGGCYRTDDLKPEADAKAIGFEAGSMLLRDDATKTTGIIEGQQFAVNDTIDVFGRRHGESVSTEIFDRTKVKKISSTSWSYAPAPLRYWDWKSPSDFYDFLGVYPKDKASEMDIPGYLAVQADYDIHNDNYDLMLACHRRFGNAANPCEIVPLHFSHALSAVQVVVTNESNDADILLDSISFQNILVKGSAKATIDAMDEPEYTWINLESKTTPIPSGIRGYKPESSFRLYGKNNQGEHSKTIDFELFIPADLTETSNGSVEPDPDDAAAMVAYKSHIPLIRVFYNGKATPAIIHLRYVEKDDRTPIDEWEPGIKYVYNIRFRFDGDVIVRVVTTEWDTIIAETQGILINE